MSLDRRKFLKRPQILIIVATIAVGLLAVSYYALILSRPVTTTETLPPQSRRVTNSNSGVEPAHLEILGGEISKQDGKFTFMMEVAASVPEKPALPSKVVELQWLFHVMDPEIAQECIGYPYAPDVASHGDLWIMVVWNGEKFEGLLIDRRPLCQDREAVILPVPFNIEGKTLKLFVDPSMAVEMPAQFGFHIHTIGFVRPRGEARGPYSPDLAIFDIGAAGNFPQ